MSKRGFMIATEQRSTPITEKQKAVIARMERALRGTRGAKTDTTGYTTEQAADLINRLRDEISAADDEEDEVGGGTAQEVVQQPTPQPTPPPAPAPTPVPAPSPQPPQSQPVPQATQVTQPPAAPKQLETIARMARTQGKTFNTEGLSRAQASEIISNLIGTMQERGLDQGEWPPVPPQSSEAQPQREYEARTMDAGARDPQAMPQANPVGVAQARANDNPFASDGSDMELSTLGDEDEAEDPELVRTVPAPVGGPFAFQIVTADWVPPKNSQYGGIRLTCVGLPAGNEAGKTADGTEAGDYLSMNPNSRWRHEALLAAINEERCKRSQLDGHTFWATTEEDNWERTNEETGETRVIKRTRIKDYLEGPSPKPLSDGRVNGTATPAKPVARLGAEFA